MHLACLLPCPWATKLASQDVFEGQNSGHAVLANWLSKRNHCFSMALKKVVSDLFCASQYSSRIPDSGVDSIRVTVFGLGLGYDSGNDIEVCPGLRIIRVLLPLFLLAVFSVYLYINYASLPTAAGAAMPFLPYLLAALAVLLSVYFNQGRLLHLSLLLLLLFVGIDQAWLQPVVDFAVVAVLLPVLILVLMLVPEQGVTSGRAFAVHALVLLGLAFMWWLSDHEPAWVSTYFLTEWLPARYFDWTQIPQSALLSAGVVFLSLLMVLALRQDVVTAAGLGVFLTLMVLFHEQTQVSSRVVFTSTAFLLILFSVLQLSWRMAYLDELTGLPGRRALREKLRGLMGIYAIAMVDVDHFKKFNDRYGHDTGDEVLRMVAAKLKQVSGGGSAFRYGGEEFTLVFPGKGVDDAKPYVEAVRETIANTAFVVNRQSGGRKPAAKNKTVKITASMGLADSITNASTDATLKQADKALYKAKKRGRNRVSL